MSISGAYSILTQSMRNFQTGLNVTANNIANSETAGYSRQVMGLTENDPLVFDRNTILGQGASISSITRIRNSYLDSILRQETSDAARQSSYLEVLKEIAVAYPDIASATSTSGLSAAMDSFYDAWQSLSASPASASLKAAVVADAIDLAERFQQTSIKLGNLLNQVDAQVTDTVDKINAQLDAIAQINQKITSMGGTTTLNDLADQRDQALLELSKLVKVNASIASDGTASVICSKGSLVNGGQAAHLDAHLGDGNDHQARVLLAGSDITSSLSGGKLGGLLEGRNGALLDSIQLLNSLATGVIDNSNTVYQTAKDASGVSRSLFNGYNASNISVDSTIATTPNGAALLSEYTPSASTGALASSMAALRTMYSASLIQTVPGTSISTFAYQIPGDKSLNTTDVLGVQYRAYTALALTTSGTLHVSVGTSVNADIAWTSADSLNGIVERINTALAGAGVAGYNDTTGVFSILTSAAISVWDVNGNFAAAMNLSAVVKSGSNINGSVDADVAAGNGALAIGSNAGMATLMVKPTSSGTFVVGNAATGVTVNWTGADSLNDIAGLMTSGDYNASFDTDSQRLVVYALANALGRISSFSLSETKGNFLDVADIKSAQSATDAYAAYQSQLSGEISAATLMKEEATTNTQSVQGMIDEVSTVDVADELVTAREYQRAYEASYRMLLMLDELMNLLINRVGTSSASASGSN